MQFSYIDISEIEVYLTFDGEYSIFIKIMAHLRFDNAVSWVVKVTKSKLKIMGTTTTKKTNNTWEGVTKDS